LLMIQNPRARIMAPVAYRCPPGVHGSPQARRVHELHCDG